MAIRLLERQSAVLATYLKTFGAGAVQGFTQEAQMLWHAINNPRETIANLGYVILNDPKSLLRELTSHSVMLSQERFGDNFRNWTLIPSLEDVHEGGVQTGRGLFTLGTFFTGYGIGSGASRTGSTGARVASVSVPSANTTGIVSASGLNVVRAPAIASIRTSYLRANVPKLGETVRNQSLMRELASSGVKYNASDVVMITRTPEGKIVWLEKGNNLAGLRHIEVRHASDLASRGIADIPGSLTQIMNTTPINVGTKAGGHFADFIFNGNTFRVVYGTNGYIVSFFPI